MKILSGSYDSVIVDVREEQQYLKKFDLGDLNSIIFYNKEGYISDDVSICLGSSRINRKFTFIKFIFPKWFLYIVADYFSSIESLRLNLGKKYKVDPFVEENGKKEFNVYRDYDYKFNFQVRDIIEMLGKNLSKYQIIFDKNEEWICIREA